MSVIDDSLPFILNILLANAVSLAGLLAVVLLGEPLLALVLLPLGAAYRCAQACRASACLASQRVCLLRHVCHNVSCCSLCAH